MKKFLLLLVGVLFALSANAEIYLRGYINGQDKWNSTETEYAFTQLEGNTYYLDLSGKLSFTTTDEFVIYDTYTKKYHQANGNKDATVVGVEYQTWENSNNNLHMSAAVQNPYIKLDISNWKITITEKATTHSFYLRGNINGDDKWGSDKYAFTFCQEDGSYICDLSSSFSTLNANSEIKIYDNTGKKWYGRQSTDGDNTKYIYKDTEYTLGTLGSNDNIFVNATISNPVLKLVVDGTTLKLTISEKTTPTPDYSDRKIVIAGFDTWDYATNEIHPRFTYQSGSIYTLDLTGKTFGTGTAFKIYDITGKTGDSWGIGYGPKDDNANNKITPGEAYELKQSSSTANLYVTSEIVNPQFTLDVATWKLTISPKAVTPTSYVWRLHTNIITGSWPAADNTLADYAMTKQEDGVTWVWEGRVSNSGFFGFKRLNEGDKPSNYTPWFYCNSNSDYNVAVNTPTTGKLKNGNSDTSGHDWQWNLTPGRYRISLNATNPDAPVITITALDSDYSGLVYVIAGTFNGWTAPDTYLNLDKENQPFTFTYDEGTKKYVWRYTGTMKNVSFKISNMTDAATDNDPHWGKAFGYSYNNDGTVANLSLDNAYQMRRTNVPGEDVFIDYQDMSNNPLTLVNPTFTLDPSNMTLVVKNNPKPEPTGTYYFLRGYWGETGPVSKALTFVGDGTYVWEGSFGTTSNRFYISKSTSAESDTKTDMLTPKKGVYNEFVETGIGTFTAAQTGIKYECLWNTDAGDKPAKWTFGVEGSNLNITTTYRLVFDPEAKTVVIYSLAPVTAQYEALEKSTDAGQAVGQAVNNLFVELNPSEYLPVEATDSYSLQIGGKVVANGYVNEETGLYRFDFMPYFVNDQELTLVASATKSAKVVVKPAGALDVNATKGDVWFEGSQEGTTYYASINLPFTTSSSVVYNFPHVTYTRNDQVGTFEANVVWTDGGFTIVVPQAIVVNEQGKYTGADVKFSFKFTPVIPFAVYTAPVAGGTGSATPAAPATNLTLQEFGGTANTIPLIIKGSMIDVSGVEGVVIEAEDAPVEYYNLQGQRVNGDLAPGIYIRRQGTTVTKVRI